MLDQLYKGTINFLMMLQTKCLCSMRMYVIKRTTATKQSEEVRANIQSLKKENKWRKQ